MIIVEAGRRRLDRPILVSNLASGALCLSFLALVAWPLALVGAVSVVAGSVFLAAVYAQGVRTTRQEVVVWTAPWLIVGTAWAAVIVGIEFDNTASHYLFSLCFGLLVATPCYLVWQSVALAIRQFLAWRSGRPFLPT